MSLYNYPHTGNYDQDLGFLIRQYKKLNKDYDTLVKIYEQVKKDIEDITIEQLQKWLDEGVFDDIINKLIYTDKLPTEPHNDTTYMVGNTINTIISKSESISSLELKNSINKKFTIATFNFLATNYWQYGNREEYYYNDMLVGYQELIKSKATIIGLNEFNDSNYYNNEYKLKNKLYPYFIKNTWLSVGKGGISLGDAVMSKLTPINIIKYKYSTDFSGDDFGFINFKVNINNKTISVYVSHITSKDGYKNVQLKELCDNITRDATEYKVVMGDLNIDYITEFNLLKPILELGLIPTNTTQPTFKDSNAIVDYILITPNISYSNVTTVFSSASDHALLYCDLEV